MVFTTSSLAFISVRVKLDVIYLYLGCKSIVKEKPKLIEHLRRHTQEKMYACAVCGQLFANFAKLSDHHARQTTSGIIYWY